MIYKAASFSMTSSDPYPVFKVTPFFDAECIRNDTRYRHSFIRIVIGTYTCRAQQRHFEWSRVTLSDLAKYSITHSVARSLCDSWASCTFLRHVAVQSARYMLRRFCLSVRLHVRSLHPWTVSKRLITSSSNCFSRIIAYTHLLALSF